jgi:hypothetical protein
VPQTAACPQLPHALQHPATVCRLRSCSCIAKRTLCSVARIHHPLSSIPCTPKSIQGSHAGQAGSLTCRSWSALHPAQTQPWACPAQTLPAKKAQAVSPVASERGQGWLSCLLLLLPCVSRGQLTDWTSHSAVAARHWCKQYLHERTYTPSAVTERSPMSHMCAAHGRSRRVLGSVGRCVSDGVTSVTEETPDAT